MVADTTAHRDRAVLVVIDEQERLAAVMERREAVRDATLRLVRTAALVHLPIIVTRQYPRGLGDVEPQLAAALAVAREAGSSLDSVDKVAFDCFAAAAFAEAVERSDRRQIILVGMETHICVAQTALSALRAGFDVHVAADACCSRDTVAHDLALERLRASGAVVTVVESAMYELVGEAGTDEFRALLEIVKR